MYENWVHKSLRFLSHPVNLKVQFRKEWRLQQKPWKEITPNGLIVATAG